MTLKQRHMKKYSPRRRRSSEHLQKQQIKELKQLLNLDLSSFLILKKQGNPKQALRAKTKIQSDLWKHGLVLENIAKELGEEFPDTVKTFLKAVRELMNAPGTEVDSSLFVEQKRLSKKLDAILRGKLS
ncbi:MAG: hypothetical protein KR126chlam1_01309 [Chlamydiae bacterium]|nr:hypothetical protein [Chlamydiota bacterium]